ncbi:MAG: gliding motility-associated C-terminal domain-containing protein [Bacteroidota bacterium]
MIYHKLRLLHLLLFGYVSLHSADYYWVGNGGNWSDLTHWATESGGNTFHTVLPDQDDDIYFDDNSFSLPGQTVFFAQGVQAVGSFDCSGMNINVSFDNSAAGRLSIYGNFILSEFAQWDYFDQQITLTGDQQDKILYLPQDGIDMDIFFDRGSFNIMSNIQLAGRVIIGNCNIELNSYDIVLHSLRSLNNANGTLKIEGSNLILRPTNQSSNNTEVILDDLELQSNMETNIISQFDYTNIDITYGADTLELNKFLIFGEGDIDVSSRLYVDCKNVFLGGSTELRINAHFDTLELTKGEKYTIFPLTETSGYEYAISLDHLVANGTCSAPIYLVHTRRPVSILMEDYVPEFYSQYDQQLSHVILENIDIHETSGSWVAVEASEIEENTGWADISTSDARTLYWIGENENWFDTQNWSLSSGGTGGACLPKPQDRVIFDDNSFSSVGQAVRGPSLDFPLMCGDMEWRVPDNVMPRFEAQEVQSFGSVYLPSNFDYRVSNLFLRGGDQHNFDPAGVSMKNVTVKTVDGEYRLENDLFLDSLYSLRLDYGFLGTNDFRIETNSILVNGIFNPAGTLDLGNSIIRIKKHQSQFVPDVGEIRLARSGSITSTGAKIRCETRDCKIQLPRNFYAREIYFIDSEGEGVIEQVPRFTSRKIVVDHLSIAGDGKLDGNFELDTITLNSGKDYLFPNSAQSIIVNDLFDAVGTICDSISISPVEFFNRPRNTNMSFGENIKFKADYLQLDQILVEEPFPIAYAGKNSRDVGGSDSWTFDFQPGCPPFSLSEGFLGRDTFLCANLSDLELTPLVPANFEASYQWNTGERTEILPIEDGGTYSQTITFDDGRCSLSDTVTVIPDLEINLPEALYMSELPWVDFDLEINGGEPDYAISWSGDENRLACLDCVEQRFSPLSTQTFGLSVEDSNGCWLDREVVVIDARPMDLYIPNAFSPNLDGVNDYLTIYGDGERVAVTSFRVFDRWGQLLFESKNTRPDATDLRWDGRAYGKQLPMGVYVVQASLRWANGFEHTLNQDVLLIR